jgi:hypothetical protein
MAFQVVELILDADDNVTERRVVPYPYQTRAEAVDTIESVMTRFAEVTSPMVIFGGPSTATVKRA